jgi:hypothetical protein
MVCIGVLHSTANVVGIGPPQEPFFVPIESERRLYLFILTRFLHANRHPLRWKTL